MTSSDMLSAVEACEQRLVNLWPSVETLLMGRWALRFAHGYSGRANSASALWRDADLTDAELDWIAARYRAAGLPPAIRVTPLAAPGLEARLAARGWRLRTASAGMIADADPSWRADARVRFEEAATDAWLAGVSALQPDPAKADPARLGAIVGRIRTGAGFATIHADGAPVGYGMVGHDRGYAEIGSIILAAGARGRGLGRALVTSLLAHGVALGAARVFLQVENGNTPAETLYAALGFGRLYDYREYRPA